MLILSSNTKGGCGKTTLAALMLWSQVGKRDLAAVDMDVTQLALSSLLKNEKSFLNIPVLPSNIETAIEASKAGRTVVVDMPPAQDKLLALYKAADIIVIPARCSPINMFGLQAVWALAPNKKKIRIIANCWSGYLAETAGYDYICETYGVRPPQLPQLAWLERNIASDDPKIGWDYGMTWQQRDKVKAALFYIWGNSK